MDCVGSTRVECRFYNLSVELIMSQQVPRFRGGQPLAQQLTATTLNRIVDELNSLRIVGVTGGTMKRLPNGTSISVTPTYSGGGAANETAFQLFDASDDTEKKIRVKYGALNGVTPTNMNAGDAPPCLLPLPQSGDHVGYVYLEGLFNSDVTQPAPVISATVKISEGGFTPLPPIVENYWKLQVPLGTYSLTGDTLSIAQGAAGSVMAIKNGFSFAWGNY